MTWTKIAVLFLLFVAGVQGQTVWEALKASSEPIDQFRSLIEAAGQASFLKQSTCTKELCNSVFVPTNGAMARAYPSGTGSLTLDQKKAIVQNHICHISDKDNNQIKVQTSAFENGNVLKYGETINFGSSVTAGKFIALIPAAGGTTLYWTKKTNGSVITYYVNNALLKPGSEKVADGGTFHVINDVISPLPRAGSVYDFIKGNADFSQFVAIYNAFVNRVDGDATVKSKLKKSYEGQNKQSTTSFFIPENSGFDKIPSAKMDMLKQNDTEALKFLVSHMAYNQLVFISWMRNTPPINLKMKLPFGTPPLSFDAKMYSENNATSNYISCGGVTATIRGEGQPLERGLLFRISKPLNFLYTDVSTILSEQSNSFRTACLANTKCRTVLQSGNVTVFAPSASETLPRLNATLTEKFLLLHILPKKRLSTPEMRKGMIEAITDVGDLRFHPGDRGEMSVSGRFYYKVGKNGYSQGYVGGRVMTPNLAGRDGVVHIIQNPLGYATQSIYQLLSSKYATFSVLIGYLNKFDLKQSLEKVPENGQHYTFFAPTNAAFAKMTDKLGKQILEDETMRNRLLKRLIVLNVVVMSSLKLDQKYSVTTALPYMDKPNQHAKLSIQTSMNRQQQRQTYVQDESITVSFLPGESEWGCTNGIVYALDTVPYNSKSVDRVCSPGATTCGGQKLFLNGFWILLITTAAAMVLRLD